MASLSDFAEGEHLAELTKHRAQVCAERGHEAPVAALAGFTPTCPRRPSTWTKMSPSRSAQSEVDGAPEVARSYFRPSSDPIDALRSLVIAAVQAGNYAEALIAAERVVSVQPEESWAWTLLGHVRARMGDSEGAVRACERALALDAANVAAHFNLGVSLQALGCLQDAEAAYRAVLEANANHLGAWVNLGASLKAQGRVTEAIQIWRQAESRFPNCTELQYNLGCALLQTGQWIDGWPGYEQRWRALGRALPVPEGHAPRWRGQQISCGTLLVHHEQGFGDTIQFARFLRQALAACREVVFVCPPRLYRLLRSGLALSASEVDRTRLRLVPEGGPLPAADAWIPLLSIPALLRQGWSDFDPTVPYLAIEPEHVSYWKARLDELCPSSSGILRVGVVWQGNPQTAVDNGRSFPLAVLESLARLPFVKLIFLQKGQGREQIEAALKKFAAVDVGLELDNGDDGFIDTAAVLHCIDLLVTCDTAVAHLAGALGRPVWVLLKHVPDWRWGLEGRRTPWYPTMRLFRQSAPGDWYGTVAAVADALQMLGAARRELLEETSTGAVGFGEATAAHARGDLGTAISGYREALRGDPDRPELLHLLAAALVTPSPIRDEALAVTLAEWAVDLAPRLPDVHSNAAYVLKSVGRHHDSEILYRHALVSTSWAHTAASVNLVNLLLAKGANHEAISVAERFVSSCASPTSFAVLARALEAGGRFEKAIAFWRKAIQLEPKQSSHRVALGRLLAQCGDEAAAAEVFEEALAADQNNADAWTNLGVIERSRGLEDLAIWFHKRAVASRPDHAAAWANLGVSLLDRGAIEHGRAALCEAIKLRPDYADARMALGMSLLLQGRFAEGLAEYEYRHNSTKLVPITLQLGPMWNGQDVGGKRLLVIAEQGFGDAIQFVRYAVVLRELGAEAVYVGCRAPIAQLLSGARGVTRVFAEGERLPEFDAWAPLMSLPYLLGTTLDTVPAPVPYLSAEPERVLAWSQRLSDAPGLRVGLVWQGNPDQRVDRGRSIALSELAPLAAVPGLRLISLQKGPGIEQLTKLESVVRIESLGPAFDAGPAAFLDTAAVIVNLDLVITTDTAVAHLAGALGRPVWLLLRHPPEWRWLLDRPDSPWYPTMRLFRQEPGGTGASTWSNVVECVAEELHALSRGDRSRLLPRWSLNATKSYPIVPRSRSAQDRTDTHDLFARALAQHRCGNWPEAGRLYAKVLADQPDHSAALHMTGVLAVQAKRYRRSLLFFREASRLSGLTPELANNLALGLKGIGKLAEAENMLRHALARRPDFVDALVNLGNLLREMGKPAEAVEVFERAIRLSEAGSAAWRGYGNALRECGKPLLALSALQAAVNLAPHDADAHVDLALALLAEGDFNRGFAEYDWRWRGSELCPRTTNSPSWDGRPFPGHTLYLYGEQGLGDHIQFVRFLPLIARLGGRVIFECRSELHMLFKALVREHANIMLVEPRERVPDHDIQIPLMSVPHRLGTTLETLPAATPYLRAEADRVARWRTLLPRGRILTVGLAWQGNPRARADRGRSIPLDLLAPVLAIPGVSFIALQKEHGLEQLCSREEAWKIAHPGADFDSGPDAFLDTAAVIECVDMVLTVDTAIAHLAGALGRPTWLLLKAVPDWRWLRKRADCPWYPTMRLYRQSEPGNWTDAVATVARDLTELVRQKSPASVLGA